MTRTTPTSNKNHDVGELGYGSELFVTASLIIDKKDSRYKHFTTMSPRLLKQDNSSELNGDARWSGSDQPAVILGGKGRVLVPSCRMTRLDFSFGMWVRPEGFTNQTMTLFCDGANEHERGFAIQLIPNIPHETYNVKIHFRAKGSNKDLINVTGFGICINPNEWAFVAVSWKGGPGICSVYINGQLSFCGERLPEAEDERKVLDVSTGKYCVGANWENNGTFFVGMLNVLTIARGAIETTADIYTLGYHPQRWLNVETRYLLNSTAPGDTDTTLHGDASWGSAGVELKGQGSVRVPALRFQGGDFSFGCWVKPDEQFRHQNMHVYSDWTKQWSFQFGLKPNREFKGYQVFLVLRRDIGGDSEDMPENILVTVEGGPMVEPGRWSFIGMSWEKAVGIARTFINSHVASSGMRSTYAGEEWNTQFNDHTTHDVGMNGHSHSDYFYGSIKSLTVGTGRVGY